MDDIFDEDGDDMALSSREYDKINGDINKDGLRDGLHQGREVGLQKGFDHGYVKVFPVIESINFLKGLLQAVYFSPEDIEFLKKDDGQGKDLNEKSISQMLQDLRHVEASAMKDLESELPLQQTTLDSFNRVKISIIEMFRSLDMQIDEEAISNCSLEENNG